MNSFKGYLTNCLNLHLCLSLAFLFISCSPVLINLDSAKDEVAKYYESGQYEKDLTKIIAEAKEKFSSVKLEPNSAVVFDIDETTLDNYEAIKQIGFGFEKISWDEWVEKSIAPAIPQVKSLYDYLVQRGFKIIFITGRKDYQYNSTFKNLKSVGYVEFDTLITRGRNEHVTTAVEFKSQKRNELVAKGYEIVGCVGDQFSDCEGQNCGIIIKLPNYLYLVE